jgi:hypothetical protein
MRNGYSSIPTTSPEGNEEDQDDDEKASTSSASPVRLSPRTIKEVGTLGGLLIVCIAFVAWSLQSSQPKTTTFSTSNDASDRRLAMPYGVNFASWLSLEDYFFVGDAGAIEVATPDGTTAARCFPPLETSVAWESETDLFQQLASNHSVAHAILAFEAYRVSYIDLEADLDRVANAGIQGVRIPLSWCLTDFDPALDELLQGSDEEKDTSADNKNDEILLSRYTCLDPFYAKKGIQVRWPAVPRSLIQRLLRACQKFGLKAILDVHTYAGGTSPGTFSGVWPRLPLFWEYDNPADTKSDLGRTLFRDFLAWLEELADKDPNAFDGLGGITPMNEPAHLAGQFGPGSGNPDKVSFVPNLPADMEQAYLHSLHEAMPAGPHLRVLRWQSDALQAFRRTSLVERGIELVVNIHESILVAALTTPDENNAGGRHPKATGLLAHWWKQTTTSDERASWAVLDMHHYHAWEPNCEGTVTGHDGAYLCGDTAAVATVLDACTSWATTLRNAVGETAARLSSGEFSASTHHSVALSCTDSTTLRQTYQAQVAAAQAADVNLYFWAWKMPHGGAFRPAWSMNELMHRLGHPDFPDADISVVPCGH